MVTDLNWAAVKSFVFVVRAAPAGKTRSSAPVMDGATLPCQFPGLLHKSLVPAPVQVNAAGANRSSKSSTSWRFLCEECLIGRADEPNIDFSHRRRENKGMGGPYNDTAR